MNKNTHRQHNMDIERIILALFVIILHFNNRDMGGALNFVSEGLAQEIFIRFTESMALCAVDCFVILSGYFAAASIRSSALLGTAEGSASGQNSKLLSGGNGAISIPYKKTVLLLATCSFYRVTGYIAYIAFISHDFSVKTFIGYVIPSNWFVCLFVTLLLLSPFVIRLTEVIDIKAFNTLTGLLLILFVVVPTVTDLGSDLGGVNLNGLSTVTFTGNASGFNIALFAAMYVLGLWLRRKSGYFNRFSAWTYFAAFILFALLITVVSHITEVVWAYSDILVVCEAVVFTLMFTRVRSTGERATETSTSGSGESVDRASARGERIGKVITALAGCSYGIFIWHTMPVMIFGLWPHFDIPGHFAAGSGIGSMFALFVAAVLSMYILSLIWVLTCRLVRMKISSILSGRNK